MVLNLKSFILELKDIFGICWIVNTLFDVLSDIVEQTTTEVDDQALSVLRLAFRYVFPDCFQDKS